MLKNSISYSEYSAAGSCLRKYMHMVEKTPMDLESGDMAFGTALHAGINAILEGDDGNAVFEALWLMDEDKPLKYSRYKWEALGSMGVEFLRKFKKLQAKKYVIQIAEKRLYSTYKSLRLEGTPDFIGTFEGIRSLRDFKTSAYSYPEEKIDTALQLYVYAYLAIQSEGFVPETLGYDVFNKGTGSIQNMTWEFSEKKMYAYLDDMDMYVSLWSKQDAYPKNVGACVIGSNTCSYFNSCWKGKP